MRAGINISDLNNYFILGNVFVYPDKGFTAAIDFYGICDLLITVDQTGIINLFIGAFIHKVNSTTELRNYKVRISRIIGIVPGKTSV